MDNLVDNYGDKVVDKSVDNSVNKSEDNLSRAIDANEAAWFTALAEHMTQLYPDITQAKKEELKQLVTALGLALDAGHTCLFIEHHTPKNTLMQHPAIVDEKQAEQQPAPLVRAGDYLYFYRQWQQENQLAAHLARILAVDCAVTVQFDPDESANPLQRQAICLAARYPFSVITGGPGTGKTYTLARIVNTLQQVQPDLRIALAAPTGKAAQRMQAVLVEEFNKAGIQSHHIQTAQTVHRLLGLGINGRPRYHVGEPLPYDLIVLDEGSMLDLALAYQLIAAIAPGTRFIILGDADQLSAVDAGAVLADLQQTPALAPYQVHLTQSRRFDSTRGIGQLASAILNKDAKRFWQAFSQSPEQLQHHNPGTMSSKEKFDQLWQGFFSYIQALKQRQAPDDLLKIFDQYRILTAMRAGELGVQRINLEMSLRLKQALGSYAGQSDWFLGRPVMMNRNDYSLQLSNGDIGICLRTSDQQGWQVYFPHLRQPIAASRLPVADISTAFALTIHKSQGSEFSRVAVVLDMAAKDLLSRELLYTAVTRAKHNVDLWSEVAAAEQALNSRLIRKTGFKQKLQEMLFNDTNEHVVTSA